MDELVRLYAATLGHRYFQTLEQLTRADGTIADERMRHACDCGWRAKILNPTDKSERPDQWFTHVLFYESQKANKSPKA